MKTRWGMLIAWVAMTLAAQAAERPNILFCIADDASMSTFGAYGGTMIKTPAVDKLAEGGALFRNAYNCNPKCSPARACLVTGMYSWQLEQACNHVTHFPAKFKFYPRLLKAAGFHVGYAGKGWAPGTCDGGNPAGQPYKKRKLVPPYAGIKDIDYAGNFSDFLNKKPEGQSFCFWLGTHEPHRSYEKDAWKKAGLKLKDAVVPPFYPDNDTIRGDILDYALEVEWFDRHVGLAVAELEKRGLLENTLIIVTSDHGMPFPRVKGQLYEEGFHVPMVAYWNGVIQPGRVIEDFVNFPDVAPTFMEAVGLKPHAQMTGRSFLDVLQSPESGWLDSTRDHVLLGKERHDKGRSNEDGDTIGYPVRAIRTRDFLYVHHFKPERWPAGNPELGLKNCDSSPTKSYLTQLKPSDPEYRFYELSFGKRPAEELYQIRQDPHCMNNLATHPEYAEVKARLNQQLEVELTDQQDPRMLGQGDRFDHYPYGGHKNSKKKPKG